MNAYKFVLWAFLFCFSLPGYGGPNWEAIEYARQEKAEEKLASQEELAQQLESRNKQEIAFEKLELACLKAAGQPDISAACDEIKAAYKELRAVKE